jgi:hypothetical protein
MQVVRALPAFGCIMHATKHGVARQRKIGDPMV